MDDNIENWARMIVEQKELFEDTILEADTPSTEEAILASFSKDVSPDKYVPTVGFLTQAYKTLKERFFPESEHMPSVFNLEFDVKSAPRADWIGTASYRIKRITDSGFLNDRYKVIPLGITLNGSRTQTLHEWLETTLHEMVHVCDYVNNPDHFTGAYRKWYDPHGAWFLNYGKRFQSEGFHVEKYCRVDVGINTDDKRVKKVMNGSIFMVFDGMITSSLQNASGVARISANDKEKYKEIMDRRVQAGYCRGLKRLVFYSSENPNIIKLSQLRMRSWTSGLRFYYFDDDFKRKYGPFEEIESYEIGGKKDGSMTEDEHLHHNMEDEIENGIGSVVDVEKVARGTYDVTIA